MKVFAAYFPISQVCMYFHCLCFSAYPFSNSFIESAVCRQNVSLVCGLQFDLF